MQDPESKKSTDKRRYMILGAGGCVFLASLLALALTQDIIMTNILAYRLCKADPTGAAGAGTPNGG